MRKVMEERQRERERGNEAVIKSRFPRYQPVASACSLALPEASRDRLRLRGRTYLVGRITVDRVYRILTESLLSEDLFCVSLLSLPSRRRPTRRVPLLRSFVFSLSFLLPVALSFSVALSLSPSRLLARSFPPVFRSLSLSPPLACLSVRLPLPAAPPVVPSGNQSRVKFVTQLGELSKMVCLRQVSCSWLPR